MTSELKATLIDVGWGDSIFLESCDGKGKHFYALVDSNDTTTLRSSYIFLRRFFEKKYAAAGLPLPDPQQRPLFEWVLLTHAHSDHAQGLKRVIQEFGTKRFWYPNTGRFQPSKSGPIPGRPGYVGPLMRFVRNSSLVRQYDPVDTKKKLPPLGDVTLKVLWPTRGLALSNENNNSVVLLLALGNVSFLLTGDAEAEVWNQNTILKGQPVSLASRIPKTTEFFKLPHHGSDNGMFESGSVRRTPWLDKLTVNTKLGI